MSPDETTSPAEQPGAQARWILAQEQQGECLACLLTLGICLMLAVVLALNSASGALRPVQVLFGAGLLGLQTAVAALGLWWARSGRYRPWLTYGTSLTSLALLTAYPVASTLTIPTTLFMASVGWLYFAIVAMAALRHSPTLVLLTGLLATLSCLGVGILALDLLADDPLPPRVAHHATPTTLATRLIYLAGTALLLGYVARQDRRLLTETARAQAERLQALRALHTAQEQRLQRYVAQFRAALQREAQMAERLRIARELHDRVAKGLVGVSLELANLTGDNLLPALRERLERLYEYACLLQQETRRVIGDLRLSGPEEALHAHIQALCAEFASQTGLVALPRLVEPLPRLPAETQYQILRILEEALANVQRHARARTVWVDLHAGATGLTMTVTDDGCGFAWRGEPAFLESGRYGLVGMRERAEAIGATLTITTAPGQGTCLHLRVPITPPSPLPAPHRADPAGEAPASPPGDVSAPDRRTEDDSPFPRRPAGG